MAVQQFFYDDQIRRFLIQFTRMFSNFQVEYGKDDAGVPALVRVPVRYGDASRQAASIIAENSRSKMPNTPMMTFYVSALDYARDRVQEPYFVDRKTFRQRTWDTDAQSYEQTQGNAFTVERLMPVPYDLSIRLDIWTSNTQQKLQILEQILPLFNPSMEIQSTDNYIDWTSLSLVELTNVTWSSRGQPTGTEDNIDIATLDFTLPIWLTAPAKVKKMGVIHKIISSIFDANGDAANALVNDDLLMGTQLLRGSQVESTEGTLNAPALQNDAEDNLVWSALIDNYGALRAGISQIRLTSDQVETEIVGTVASHPSDDRILLFSLDSDTIPQNTLDPLTAVVDPTGDGPGVDLPAAVNGQRYLLTESIGKSTNSTPASAWGSLVASTNDIIQYNGSSWSVVFDASARTSDDSSYVTEFVTNATTGIQYKWNGQMWLKSYQGLYKEGEWSLVL